MTARTAKGSAIPTVALALTPFGPTLTFILTHHPALTNVYGRQQRRLEALLVSERVKDGEQFMTLAGRKQLSFAQLTLRSANSSMHAGRTFASRPST